MKKITAILLVLTLLFSGLVITSYADNSTYSDNSEDTQALESSSPSFESAPEKYIYLSPEEIVVSYDFEDEMSYEINVTGSAMYDSLVVSYATTVNVTLDDYRRDIYAYNEDGITLSVDFAVNDTAIYDEIITDYHEIEFEEIRLYVRAFLDGELVDGEDYIIYVLPTVNGVFVGSIEKYYAYSVYLDNLLENELITEAQRDAYLRSVATLITNVEYDNPKDADSAVEAKLAELSSGTVTLKHLASTYELINTPPTIQANKNNSSVFDTSSDSELVVSNIPKVDSRATIPSTANRVRIDRTIFVADANIRVYGYLYWYDIDGKLHPMRGAKVTVFDKDALTNQNYGSMYSNDLGAFEINLTNDTSWLEGGLDIFLRIDSLGNGFTVKDYNATSSLFSTNYYFDTGVKENVKSTVSQTSYISVNTEAPNRDKAFQIQQALYTGFRYFRAMNSNNVKTVTAFYPANNKSVSYSNSTGIYIRTEDSHSWDIVLHELGHQVEDHLGIKGSYDISSHYIGENLAIAHGKNVGTIAAWGEGWASYFAIAAQKYFHTTLGITLANITTANNTSDEKITVSGSNYTLTNRANYSTYSNGAGEAEEGAITSVLLNMLWDTNIGKTDQQLWNIAKNSGAKTFDAFMDAFYSQNTNMKVRSAVGQYLEKNQITNWFSQTSTSIFSKTTPPTLQWNIANTETDDFPYTNTIAFWDKNYNRITTVGNITGNGINGITLTSAQWNALVSAVGNDIFYWGIISTQTSSPSTGPYYTSLQKGVFSENITNITSTGTTSTLTLTAGKENWYKISVPANGNYKIYSANTPSVNALLFISTNLNDRNAFDTDSGNGSTNPIMIYSVISTSNPVYLCIRGSTTSASGTYTITITKTD